MNWWVYTWYLKNGFRIANLVERVSKSEVEQDISNLIGEHPGKKTVDHDYRVVYGTEKKVIVDQRPIACNIED